MFLTLSGCATAPPPAPRRPPTGPTAWTFSDPGTPLAAASGPAALRSRSPREPKARKSSELGLPTPPGGDKIVLALTEGGPWGGLELTHRAPPNGVFLRDGLVSNYTLVFDALWPAEGPPYRAILQSNPANADDADLFARLESGGARLSLGQGNGYYGSVRAGTWHRIAVAVQSALGAGGTGQLALYVDGAFAGSKITDTPGKRCRWSLGESLLLFADEDGETGPLYLSNLSFTDRFLPMAEIQRLGGPSFAPDLPGDPPPAETRRLPGRVEVIAHRGASCCAPENTLASIDLAFKSGADAAEVDVRLSADKVAVLMHDERLERTTDGKGFVSETRLSKLKKLDAGSWFDPAFAEERVPTLAEALKTARGRGRLLLDVKLPGMGSEIAKALREAQVGPEAIRVYRSVEGTSHRDILKFVPGVELLFGAVPSAPAELERLKAEGVAGLEVNLLTVTSTMTAAARSHGLPVTVYTALSPEEMLKAGQAGVSGIETDYPAVLKALLP